MVRGKGDFSLFAGTGWGFQGEIIDLKCVGPVVEQGGADGKRISADRGRVLPVEVIPIAASFYASQAG